MKKSKKDNNTPKNKELDLELLKLQLQLSWNWFDLHAKQRMSLFNFFLIITGVLVNAYAIAIGNNLNILAFAVCVIGLTQSIGFITFDIRSRQLTRYSEDVIEKLERDFIFPDNFNHLSINRGKTLGLLRRDADNNMREGQQGGILFYAKRINKMKFWIRLVQLLVCLSFLVGLIYQIVFFMNLI